MPPPTQNAALLAWVAECVRLCQPDTLHWCDGSEDEKAALIAGMLADGSLHPLHAARFPGCYLHRSNPNDVARVEQVTFICSELEADAGPTNNWMSPADARAKLTPLFDGCMRGRTLYVIPYVMGPVGSPLSKIGVEITDSAYVALSMRTMTRVGTAALEQLGANGEFVPGLHSIGELDPARRFVCHFPDERLIWSYGSGYGGNALLGKKCFALRIASAMAQGEGWMAEHMLLLELTDPQGAKTYFAGAFPSACGKTNLAMLIPPPALATQGWQVRTIGDDIAWMHVGTDGRLWAINPEAGFFGVAPGTSHQTNPNALATTERNTLFTNVAVTDDGLPWWEGIGWEPETNAFLTDWKGNRRPFSDQSEPFAHPNSRFTAPAAQCPCLSPHWEDPQGVPISGILFGGRRNTTVPLVLEAFSWQHGVFLGATMASRTTAAAAGATGVLRRDPFAMLPFCGYHMGDYFAHWLQMGLRIPRPPAVFQVNWFRKDADGSYLWPGYGENLRALIWMNERIAGRGSAVNTPVGLVPSPGDLHLAGLDVPADRVAAALQVRTEEWGQEIPDIKEHFARFGERLPRELRGELAALEQRLRD
ncbi:MAG: phosphoenolpyruvate carboxykinase (GTP) [Cytophagales bacterium]|nr:phosphoenolpyruvate carboxykinase (GTP) [Armatimonadota bacterium]